MLDKIFELEIKKSRFIAYLYRIKHIQDFELALEELKKDNKKATHICYAYKLSNPFLVKCCDDGEPSGTAGRPILSVIEKNDLSDVAVFVVRYFGGVKLGAGGLVRAYTKAAAMLLKD